VRSALLAVKGVSRAKVMLEGHEAIVTYDPREATVQDLIAAVNQAQGPADFISYHATVKESSPR
jgi:copper chaperone CopZ